MTGIGQSVRIGTDQMTLSVVVVDVDGMPALGECLGALGRQRGGPETEIIVVSRRGVAEELPGVRLVGVDAGTGIPAMRARGLREARGEIVAFTEARCLADENWLAEMVQAQRPGYAGVGGPVEPGGLRRLVDWAVYLCEYSGAMLPIPAGEVGGLPGNNAAYRRAALAQIDEAVFGHYWESFFQEELKQRGARFLSAPGMVVRKSKEFGFGYFLAQRFHFSRSFAGMRRARLSAAARAAYVLGSPLLPALMLGRIAGQVFAKRRFRREFLLSLPLLGAFLVSYTLGELTGYLAGAGESLAKVE